MWEIHHSAISTITLGTPKQKILIDFTNALNAELHYHKLVVDLFTKEQAVTMVSEKEAHKLYMLAQHFLRKL